MIPATMTAIAVEGGKGPAEALKPVQIPRPEPGPGQILIRVHAAGINRPDILQRLGGYPPPTSSSASRSPVSTSVSAGSAGSTSAA